MEENKITDIAEDIIDTLGETINNHLYQKFGHSLDAEEYERLNNLVWDELIKQLS